LAQPDSPDYGLLSYASSPIWLVVLTLSSIIVCIEALHGHPIFRAGLLFAVPQLAGVARTEIVALLSIT